eukprot:1148197-Pelagomonas_calceolata.AAC.1
MYKQASHELIVLLKCGKISIIFNQSGNTPQNSRGGVGEGGRGGLGGGRGGNGGSGGKGLAASCTSRQAMN